MRGWLPVLLITLQGGHGDDGTISKRPSKRSAPEEVHEDLGVRFKLPIKKQKSLKKGGSSATKPESQGTVKQKLPVKKTPVKKIPPKRKVLSYYIAGLNFLQWKYKVFSSAS